MPSTFIVFYHILYGLAWGCRSAAGSSRAIGFCYGLVRGPAPFSTTEGGPVAAGRAAAQSPIRSSPQVEAALRLLDERFRDVAQGGPHAYSPFLADPDNEEANADDDEIVAAASNEQIRLVIMGTQRRTVSGRLFFGSVAERVVRKAACSVMTARSHNA